MLVDAAPAASSGRPSTQSGPRGRASRLRSSCTGPSASSTDAVFAVSHARPRLPDITRTRSSTVALSRSTRCTVWPLATPASRSAPSASDLPPNTSRWWSGATSGMCAAIAALLRDRRVGAELDGEGRAHLEVLDVERGRSGSDGWPAPRRALTASLSTRCTVAPFSTPTSPSLTPSRSVLPLNTSFWFATSMCWLRLDRHLEHLHRRGSAAISTSKTLAVLMSLMVSFIVTPPGPNVVWQRRAAPRRAHRPGRRACARRRCRGSTKPLSTQHLWGGDLGSHRKKFFKAARPPQRMASY